MGNRGYSYDNALAEPVIGLFKTELIRRKRPWQNAEDVEFATLKLGLVVQPSQATRTHRPRPTGRVRRAVPRSHPGHAGHSQLRGRTLFLLEQKYHVVTRSMLSPDAPEEDGLASSRQPPRKDRESLVLRNHPHRPSPQYR